MAECVGDSSAEAATRRLALETQVPADLPAVHADPHRVRQILGNLLGNALEFTPPGGTIRVEAGVAGTDPATVWVAVADPPDLVILDLGLPAGGGFTVLERLRRNMDTAIIPVVVLTAGDVSLGERARTAGAAAFFQKPGDNDELLDTISGVLARKAAT